MNRRRILRSWWLWAAVILFCFLVLPSLLSGGSDYTSVDTSQALTQVQDKNVSKAVFEDKEQTLQLTLKNAVDGHTKIQAQFPAASGDEIFSQLQAAKKADSSLDFQTKVTHENTWLSLLVSLLPILVIVGVLFFVMSQVQGGGSRVMSFGRSKAKLVSKDMPKTTFADVAGADEAIEELQEIKEFLANPAKFQAIGAKIPKGVLLYGPPGTGKTLLARAVAGEAGVPFYSISGSDFVEMFVGVGASRVRDLFEQAKSNAPAIIFVDEIDAVGRHRGAGMGGGHDEREQTLNQLLVEMDGFDVKGGVILIAATNRPDILDPALLRPGRFDRQIAVGPPDVIGREAVLKVHAKGKPFAPDVDLGVIARRTPGFTGADLANVINEAALLTARQGGRLITLAALEESIDRVIAGPERKTRAMSDKEKRVTAYHEAGHALAAWAMPNLDPVHKVTILPRGRSLGHTLVLPLEDRYTQTRAEILDQLVYALGGRAAEELVFHEPTTGASNDIEKATKLARSMVTEYGMSSKLGAVKYGSSDSEPFLGRDYGHQRDYSESIAADIDTEVRELIEGAHDEAWEILVQYRDVLDAMVLELVEKETLSKEDLERIFATVRKRPPHNTFTAFGKRTPSDRPPIEIPMSLRKPAPATSNGANGAHAANGNGQSNGNGNGVNGPAVPAPPAGYPSPQPGAFGPPPGAFGPQPGPGQPPYGASPNTPPYPPHNPQHGG
ncbi:MAG: ATP-dependent zinc metalloprotease FtsH [Jatrophihabitans sp.]|uniref:ATP-dependent zinc metalloprotease FtsH n=1 Tax=Jatrophihabitans sp. TaxID=1932789 RepID=UPI003F81D984